MLPKMKHKLHKSYNILKNTKECIRFITHATFLRKILKTTFSSFGQKLPKRKVMVIKL